MPWLTFALIVGLQRLKLSRAQPRGTVLKRSLTHRREIAFTEWNHLHLTVYQYDLVKLREIEID